MKKLQDVTTGGVCSRRSTFPSLLCLSSGDIIITIIAIIIMVIMVYHGHHGNRGPHGNNGNLGHLGHHGHRGNKNPSLALLLMFGCLGTNVGAPLAISRDKRQGE